MTASRVPLSSLANGTIWALTDGLLTPAAGATAFVYEHGTTTQVTVYAAETGGTTLTQPLTSGATGQLPGYALAEQDLDVVYTFEGKTPAAAELVLLRAADIVGVDSHTKALALGAGDVPLLSGPGGGGVSEAEVAAAASAAEGNAISAATSKASAAQAAAEAASDPLGSAATAEGKAIAAAATKATAAQAAAEAESIPLAQKGAASGVASLTAGSIGAQPPAHHASTHAEGGTDPLTTADLPASVVSSRPKNLGEVSGTPALNFNEGSFFEAVLSGATAFKAPENMPVGQSIQVLVESKTFALSFSGLKWAPSEPTFKTGTSELYLVTITETAGGPVGCVGPEGAAGPQGNTGNTGPQGKTGTPIAKLNNLGGVSFDPSETGEGSPVVTAGVLYLTKLPVLPGELLTYLWYAVSKAGEGMTSGECPMGIYIPSGSEAVLIGSAPDQHEHYESLGVPPAGQALTVRSGQSLTIPSGVDWVYMARLINGTTKPAFYRQNYSAGSAGLVNVGLTASTGYRAGTYGTGLTGLPTEFPLSGVTDAQQIFFGAWS